MDVCTSRQGFEFPDLGAVFNKRQDLRNLYVVLVAAADLSFWDCLSYGTAPRVLPSEQVGADAS